MDRITALDTVILANLVENEAVETDTASDSDLPR